MAHRSRTGSVYLAVVVVVAAVTVLVMTGVALRKQINERAVVGADSAEVARLAVSASELAAHHAVKSETFEERAATGTIFSNLALAGGTISATVRDADTKGLPTEDTENFRITADAATGAARSRIAFTVESPEDPFTVWLRAHPSVVSYWPLDEAGTTTARDRIGPRNGAYSHSFLAGTQTHEHGNPAPYFAWNTQFARVDHAPAFELANGSLAFWVRFDVKPTDDDVTVTVISKESRSPGAAMSLRIYMDKDEFYFMLDNSRENGKTIKKSDGHFDVGVWHHVVVTWGSQGMWMYIDGKKEQDSKGDRIGLDGNLWALRPPNTSPWYFGVSNTPSGIYDQSSPLVGSVARVALFSSQLNEADAATIYKLSTAPPDRRVQTGSYARVVD